MRVRVATAMMDIIPKANSLRPAVLCDTKAICGVIDCFIAAQHAARDQDLAKDFYETRHKYSSLAVSQTL